MSHHDYDEPVWERVGLPDIRYRDARALEETGLNDWKRFKRSLMLAGASEGTHGGHGFSFDGVDDTVAVPEPGAAPLELVDSTRAGPRVLDKAPIDGPFECPGCGTSFHVYPDRVYRRSITIAGGERECRTWCASCTRAGRGG